jgi:hypothetical protein
MGHSHFNLYRSMSEERGYQKIAKIPGHGTSLIRHEYRWVDRHVQEGVTYYYQLSTVSITGEEVFDPILSGPISVTSNPPEEFALKQNYPNPFNPSTIIEYQLPEDCHVRLVICDILGREVRVLVDREVRTGYHKTAWDGTDITGRPVSNGVYVVRMEAGDFVKARKMALVQ